jgi:cytochrome c551/c552
MNKLRILIVAVFAVSGWILSNEVGAEATGAEVLKAKGCTNCHDTDKKKVGPSMKDIAAKKGKPEALVAKIKEGKGHPKVNATDAELKAAVDQVLSTK